jgi:hypothetical protein
MLSENQKRTVRCDATTWGRRNRARSSILPPELRDQSTQNFAAILGSLIADRFGLTRCGNVSQRFTVDYDAKKVAYQGAATVSAKPLLDLLFRVIRRGRVPITQFDGGETEKTAGTRDFGTCLLQVASGAFGVRSLP